MTARGGEQQKVTASLDTEVDKLVKELRTKSLKKEVKAQAKLLLDKEGRKDAILFFCDIKAKGVLLAILAERRAPFSLSNDPVDEFLGLFGLDDLIGLYEASLNNSELLIGETYGVPAAREYVVQRIADRTEAILEIKIKYYPRSTHFDDVRAWWLDAINMAKRRGLHQTTLSRALEHVKKSNLEDRLKAIK